jgi:hypothetical protein
VDLFAVDDSRQNSPTRDGMGPLVAVGGLHVPGDQVRDLERELDRICAEAGFPPGEEFKWSPKRHSWEYQHLKFEARDEFNLAALNAADEAGATGMVVMADTTRSKADASAESHEEDVARMFLERAQNHLGPAHAIVVWDRPGGGRRAETDFLTASLTALRMGTSYTKLDGLALTVATDSKLSRILQLADVVTSCATSFVAGEARYAPRIFRDGILPMLRSDYGCVGGRGLKIHPDLRYGNLYHWLLDDEVFVRYQAGVSLPHRRFTAYRESPNVA